MPDVSPPSAGDASLHQRVRLETVLAELQPPERRQIFETRIGYGQAVPSFYRRWIDNLYAEPRLTRAVWNALVYAVLLLPEGASRKQVFAASVGVFRTTLGTDGLPTDPLPGTRANIPSGRCLGRVVPRPWLVSFLRNRARAAYKDDEDAAAGMGGSRRAADDFITALMKGEVFDVPEPLREVRLHDHLMWSTFSGEYHPFSGIPEHRRTLRCVLGLLGKNCELVQLVYLLPHDRPAFVPTVAEAYAGGSWEVLFQPAHPGAPVGQTIPRPDCGNHDTRPEVVHRPVALKDLNARLQTL